jgi:iron complex outermembrane receptor protein
MKRGVILLAVLLTGQIQSYARERIVKGIVTDAQTHEALGYCNIAITGTAIGTNTDCRGRFDLRIPQLDTLPTLVVSFMGYKNDTISLAAEKDLYVIQLWQVKGALNEVVVTGVSRASLVREAPMPVLLISAKALEQSTESNLIDMLVKNAGGLTAVKTGPNISKPFIRGLGYNRVLTMYDGIRQEGQQWGDEHGIEVDAFTIDHAEVIKGPASLMYGSDALAGVVSLLPAVPSEKDGKLHGKAYSEYQSNNGLLGNGVRLTYSDAHWIGALTGSYRMAKAYSNNIDGRVYNTGFTEKNISALGGYRSTRGYTHVGLTWYDNLQGIPDGSRDSASRKFTKQIAEGATEVLSARPVVTDEELNSYTLSPLHQHIEHVRVYTHSSYETGRGSVDLLLAGQQNVRREYNHPTMLEQAGMHVILNTLNYGARYTFPLLPTLDATVGVNGMYQENKAKNATDFPIPDYNLLDAGGYLYTKWKRGHWTVIGGIRYDIRRLKGDDFYVGKNISTGFDYRAALPDTAGARLQFPGFEKTFTGFSPSIGATYQVSEHYNIKANVAKGYRAPGITELASNGLDPGAHIVYLGNREFLPEYSVQEDIGLEATYEDFKASASIFNNNIAHYIYLAQLTDDAGTPVVIVPGNKTYKYQQSSAQLYGGEATLNIHPRSLKGFSFDNSFALVYGYNRKAAYQGTGIQGAYLPLIPPARLLSSVGKKVNINKYACRDLELKAELEYNGAQSRYLALDGTETATAAYGLLNLAVHTSLKVNGMKDIKLQLAVNNVTDKAYQSNLSRLKYFEYYTRRADENSGIYGMGRNICLKGIISF